MMERLIHLTAPHNFLFFSRAVKYTLPVLIAVMMIIPVINAQSGVVTPAVPAGDSTLIIDITTPQENEFFLSDVVPHHIWMTGEVKSPVPLQSIIVSSSEGSTNCGNQSSFSCDVVVAKGLDRIVVTVTDIAGNHGFRTRNIRVETGMPDLPPRITISGMITTPDGRPVEGATVRTEFPRTYDTKTVIVESDADGSYRINDAHGFNQKISVEKNGYVNVTREMSFKQNLNTVDFILEPTTKPAPGFTGVLCLGAILGTLLIISRKNPGVEYPD
jgi:hypothetical protein